MNSKYCIYSVPLEWGSKGSPLSSGVVSGSS